jgi:glycosyltransferase involved in cell wall biosynthesis
VARYYDAADLFVLPSELEALPTVAIEALASGTPVVSTDNPGGIELARLFGDDVRVVPKAEPSAFAAAVVDFLSQRRRTLQATDEVLAREFSQPVAAARFAAIYRDAITRAR